MTTAYVVDNTMKPLKDASNAEKPSSLYDHGASHINPTKALDPSLVYDIKPQDYLNFLCTQNLTTNQLGVFGKYANRANTGSKTKSNSGVPRRFVTRRYNGQGRRTAQSTRG
ncbi:hypothetical protein S83_020116 [Arachis hypogaea]